MFDFIYSWSFITPAWILFFIYYDNSVIKLGFRKKKYTDTSSLNPARIESGREWTRIKTLNNNCRQKRKTDFFIGNFRFHPNIPRDCKMPILYKKYCEKTAIYVSRTDFKKTSLVWGGMGSGKSIFFIHLLNQIDKYNNALVHDGGKLELVSKFYNPMRDIILNPFDERAKIHDFLQEDTGIQQHFFEILLKDSSGDGGNSKFFTTGAAEHLTNISFLTNKQDFQTVKERWSYFILKLDELIESALLDNQNSERDVISTLKQIMAPLYLMNFRIQDNAEFFTIDEFLDKNHAAKLFVSYPPKMRSQLSSYSSAFIALYTLVHLSREDEKIRVKKGMYKKERYHFYLIDELSSYLRMLNEPELLKDQLELLRSKGGMFTGGLQGDEEENKTMEILDKTVRNKFYFRTDGRKTKDALIKNIGKVRYEIEKDTKEGRGWHTHRMKTYSIDMTESNVIKESDFDKLGDNFEYIAIVGDNLYRGYTPLPDDEKEDIIRAEGFIEYGKKREFEDYLANKYEKIQEKKFQKHKESKVAKEAF